MTAHQSLLKLLKDPPTAGVFGISSDAAGAISRAATEAGLKLWQIDISRAQDAKELLSLVGRSMHFPDWYGQNWDALADCLADLSWSEAKGHVLLIHGLTRLQDADFSASQKFLELLQETSAIWRQEGVAFWALFDDQGTGAPDLKIPPAKN